MYNYPNYGVFETEKSIVKRQEKRGIRSVAAHIGLAYLVMMAVAFFWSLPFMAVLQGLGFSQAEIIAITEDPAIMQIIQIVVSILMFVPPYLIVVANSPQKMRNLIPLGKPNKGMILPLILISIGFCAFANIATSSIADIFAGFGIEYSAPELEIPGGVFGALLAIMATAFTPALVEEFAMRGAVMGVLRKYGDGVAIGISAAMFGLMHRNFVQIPFGFVVGIALGYAVIKTGSLWTGVIIHFINNFISVGLDLLFRQIDSVYLQSGITAIYFVLCFLCFFIGLYLMRNKKKEDYALENADMVMTVKERVSAFFSSPIIIISIVVTLVLGIIEMNM
ncbi:MAG: CPBP family intramembrane metalloprotease [Clostridia bacterium]|nr:CPBP family intramembrane metalloprotease [Clostridia bacterium]